MPPHIRFRDLPRTAWTQAIAYAATANKKAGGPKFKNSTPWAAAAWLGSLVVQFLFGHRNIYETQRKSGVVALYWNPPWGMFGRGIIFVLPVLLLQLLPSIAVKVVVIAYLVILASMGVMRSFTPKQDRAPEGTAQIDIPARHVTFATIAARTKDDGRDVMMLARRITRSLPAGTTFVAHPRTPELREKYAKAGFKQSTGRVMVYRSGTIGAKQGR